MAAPSSSSSAASATPASANDNANAYANANAEGEGEATIPTWQSSTHAAGPASSATSSSSLSFPPPSASRWNSAAHGGNSLFAVAPPAGAAQVTATKPTAPAAGRPGAPQRPGRSSDSGEEDGSKAVASMMAALSLNSHFKGEGDRDGAGAGDDGDDDDGDDDDEEDDELVGLSTKPALWGALPSFLLTEEEAEVGGSVSSETVGRRSWGTPEASSLLPGASQLSGNR